MNTKIKNVKIYIAIIMISIIFVCLINLNNIKIILNNTQNNELIAKQEENIVKGSDYTEDTNFEEFVKKDGETYDFLNEEESTAQIASSESTEQTQVIKYTNDLDEVQHLFGKYQLNFTGSNSIPLNYIMISNGYKKTYNGKTGIIKNRIKENATATDYKNGEYLKDAFYSRLSKDSNYSWIAQFEDKLSIKSRDYETMPITTIDSNNNATGTKDQKNTALILKTQQVQN